jgi:membrane protease subunit HflK
MREVIARSDIQPILTEGRSLIETDTQEIIQEILDEYTSGIQITQVQTQKADPPDQVIDAFRDVQAARADMERSKNEAEAYANDVIPRARGEAARILQAAEAYKKEVVAKAEGEASRFLAIYNEYKMAKEVTQERMYLETMEKVLADIDKVIIEKNAGSGVVPYLPLPELSKKKATN